MKKVLVLAAAIALFASPSFALIANGKHDMTAALGGAGEPCAYCHTPHGSLSDAPLWNRTWGTAAPTLQYSSSSFNGGVQDFSTLGVCFTCHDGAVTGTEIYNQLNNNDLSVGPEDLTFAGPANVAGDAEQMRNDHPVGFSYATSLAADNELNPTPAAGLLINGMVTCASCHDVHNYVNAPFLRINNAGSALCTACHIK